MSTRLVFTSSLLIGLCLAASSAAHDATESAARGPDATVYLLRYKFQSGETIRWKVAHQALVRTTVSGTTQTAETNSESIKVWQVGAVDKETGEVTFVHSVECVDMRQSVSGRQEVRFNSLTDVVAPAEFEEVSKAVGVPLSTIVIDNRGHVIKRREERVQPNANPGEMTVPLPENEVAVNDSWALPHDANVRQQDGSIRPIKTRQKFTLTAVDDGIATIHIETIVLTPIHDPALEAQLIQHVSDGDVRFDIAAGRIVGQKIDVDKRVVGFQGETSSMHYMTRFTEELQRDRPAAAGAGKPGTAPAAGTDATAKAPGKTGAASTAQSPSRAKTAPATAGNKTAAKTPGKTPPLKPKSKTGSKPVTAPQKRG